jgi:tetratricopeptide (TPR) repeat protein
MKHQLFTLLVFVLCHSSVVSQTKDTAQKYSTQQSGGIDSLWQVFNKMYDYGDSLLKIADNYFNSCEKDSAELYYVKAFDAFKEIDKKKADYTLRQREELRYPEYCMYTVKKQYDKYIAMGEAAFNAKDYFKAKEFYQNAAFIYPGEQFPKDKIAECDKQLATEPPKAYMELIAVADKLFNEKQYEKAKEAYNQALAIRPAEKYPLDKIKECEKMINEK